MYRFSGITSKSNCNRIIKGIGGEEERERSKCSVSSKRFAPEIDSWDSRGIAHHSSTLLVSVRVYDTFAFGSTLHSISFCSSHSVPGVYTVQLVRERGRQLVNSSASRIRFLGMRQVSDRRRAWSISQMRYRKKMSEGKRERGWCVFYICITRGIDMTSWGIIILRQKQVMKKTMLVDVRSRLGFFLSFLMQCYVDVWFGILSGDRNSERRNVEWPISRNFKIANIKVTKDKLVDGLKK